MIIHTLTNAQLGKPYQLLNYIDNRNNEKTIGLKSISYWVGWHNIGENKSLTFSSGSYSFSPELFNFNDVEKIFDDNSFNLIVDTKDGKARITEPQNKELELTSDIASVLGFEAGKKYTPGNHHGQIVNFAQPR